MDVVGRDLFTQDLWQTLRQFEQAENFGSLIRPALKDISFVRERLEEKGIFENLFLHDTNKRVKRVLEMAEYLSPHYHVVVANPPYMGNRGMNMALAKYAKDHFLDSKRDLGVMFIERNCIWYIFARICADDLISEVARPRRRRRGALAGA